MFKKITHHGIGFLFLATALMTSISAEALDGKVGAYFRQDLSKSLSDDNSSTYSATGGAPTINQYNSLVFKTDIFGLTVYGSLDNDTTYYIDYALLDPLSAPKGNLLEMAFISYKISDRLTVTAGRQYDHAGGIEVNYFPIGSYYMYTLASLNLVSGSVGTPAVPIVLSIYTDGLIFDYKFTENNTLSFIVGNANLANSTSAAFLANQTVPMTGITWEGKFADKKIVPFVSFLDVPIPATQNVGAAATMNATELRLFTAGTRYLSGNWQSHIDFQYYDTGQPNPSPASQNHNIESAETIYVGYMHNKYFHKLTLSRSEIDVLQVYPSEIRNGICYALEYKQASYLQLFGAFTYTQDAFFNNSVGTYTLMNTNTVVNPQALINNYNLTVGYTITL